MNLSSQNVDTVGHVSSENLKEQGQKKHFTIWAQYFVDDNLMNNILY